MNKDMQTENLLDLMFDWSRHTPTPDAASELAGTVYAEHGVKNLNEHSTLRLTHDAVNAFELPKRGTKRLMPWGVRVKIGKIDVDPDTARKGYYSSTIHYELEFSPARKAWMWIQSAFSVLIRHRPTCK